MAEHIKEKLQEVNGITNRINTEKMCNQISDMMIGEVKDPLGI